MGAHVEHRFDGNFLVDEERLRKLKNIIEGRLVDSIPQAILTYKVFRGDSYYYDTQVVDDVVSESNETWREITRIILVVKGADSFDFEFTVAEEGVTLAAAGDDRDLVFLLFSDLREYIQNEVMMKRLMPKWLSNFLLFAIFGGSTLFAVLNIVLSGANPVEFKAALDSDDVLDKLNYLISIRDEVAGDERISQLTLLAAGIVFFYYIALNDKILNFFRPFNVFLFGKRRDTYNKRRAFSDKIVWGVVIAFFVSIVAGFVVWKMTAGVAVV